MLGRVTGELNEQGYPIEVQARFQAAEIDDGFWDWLKNEADAIFLYINASDESFETIKGFGLAHRRPLEKKLWLYSSRI